MKNIKKRIDQVVSMLRSANAAGRKLKTSEVEQALSITAPTARKLIEQARDEIRGDVLGHIAVQAAPLPEVQPMTSPGAVLALSQALGTGVDLLGDLEETLNELKRLSGMAIADLELVRYVVLGDRGSIPIPAMCAECRERKAEQINLSKPSPALMAIEAKDLPKYYAEAARTLKGITDTLDTYNSVMEQFYNFVALEKTSRRFTQSVKNVCPEYSKAIAAEFRRLQQAGE